VGIDRDLSSPLPWRRSLRAAQTRRVQRARRRRLAFRGRAGIALALALTTVAAAGALAQTPAPPSSSSGASSGASGASVSAIQHALGLPADGIYGPRTRAAVRRFQRRHGLAVDGVAGPQTLAALGLSGGSGAGGDSGSSASGASGSGTGGSAGGSGSAGAPSASATLERIAQCESGGNPTAVSADGQYHGKYQFDQATWERLGGTGDPAAASEAEQDRIAAKLLAQSGTSPWPNCG
jgi:peptidoglycan hydrolase-like protein with peptidoglycan-binding domain